MSRSHHVTAKNLSNGDRKFQKLISGNPSSKTKAIVKPFNRKVYTTVKDRFKENGGHGSRFFLHGDRSAGTRNTAHGSLKSFCIYTPPEIYFIKKVKSRCNRVVCVTRPYSPHSRAIRGYKTVVTRDFQSVTLCYFLLN
jgi:hypothetical protein